MSDLAVETPAYNKKNPFPAKLVERRRLTGQGSNKETYHFVVDIAGSGMEYSCGDSLGVFCPNDPHAVQALLDAARLSGAESVPLPKSEETVNLEEALTHHYSLAGPTKTFLKYLQSVVTDEDDGERLAHLLSAENADELKAYLEYRHFVDVIGDFLSADIEPEALVSFLKRQLPRLYSIASSPVSSPEKVDLTIAVVRYEFNGFKRGGVASTYLADHAVLDQPGLPAFIASSHFGLPKDGDRDVIMVGPGTGIAPYRGFIQERKEKEATGRNWLFFGEQHRDTDYLYGDELEQWRVDGTLNELDLAFSRDQARKVYVQDKMRERGKELWDWIDGGAYFYICGDAKRMAKDVEATLLNIIEEHGGMTPGEAREYIKQMRKEKRYQKDVY